MRTERLAIACMTVAFGFAVVSVACSREVHGDRGLAVLGGASADKRDVRGTQPDDTAAAQVVMAVDADVRRSTGAAHPGGESPAHADRDRRPASP